MNLILVTIDAWRADFVDELEGVPLVPSLAPVADRTVRFDHAYANAPWTSPALVSVFSGEHPLRHRVWYEWSEPRTGGPALAATLAAAGYDVPNLCYLNQLPNYAHLGYATAGSPDYPHSPADDLLVPAIDAVRRGAAPEPFFFWFHYKFVHLPYWAADPYRRLFGIEEAALPARLRDSVCTGFVVPRSQHRLEPADRPLVRRLYAACVRQMNDWLDQVFDTLGPLADRTSVVLTSDHGEELLEHGHVGHASTAHHATLFEEVLRVPLLVIDPRVTGGPHRVSWRVQGADLLPTLLPLAGVASPAPIADGLDRSAAVLDPAARVGPDPTPARPFVLHSAGMGCPTPRERADQCVEGFTDGRRKLVRERFESPRTILFDLERDPDERHPMTTGDRVDDAVAAFTSLAGVGHTHGA